MGYVIAVLSAACAVLALLWRREASKRKAAEVLAESATARAEASEGARADYRAAEAEAEKEHGRVSGEFKRGSELLDDLRDAPPDDRAKRFDELYP